MFRWRRRVIVVITTSTTTTITTKVSSSVSVSTSLCPGFQVAVIAYMAHLGSFVPAESATVGLVDRIATRVVSREALHQSSFMVDLTQASDRANLAPELLHGRPDAGKWLIGLILHQSSFMLNLMQAGEQDAATLLFLLFFYKTSHFHPPPLPYSLLKRRAHWPL